MTDRLVVRRSLRRGTLGHSWHLRSFHLQVNLVAGPTLRTLPPVVAEKGAILVEPPCGAGLLL